MQEIGVESSVLQEILSGAKTVEGRLSKPRFLQLRVGDTLRLREDIWKDGAIQQSVSDRGLIKITQILYFESFEDMLTSLDYTSVIPSATSTKKAIEVYRQFYSQKDEQEYGVLALMFKLV